MKIFLTCLILALTTFTLHASPENFDIFGVDASMKKQIISRCAKIINKHASFVAKHNPIEQGATEATLLKKARLEQAIVKKVNKLGSFSLATVSTVFYPNEKKTYTTLDLVKESDKQRLPTPAKKRTIKSVPMDAGCKQLFSLWHAYLDRKMALMSQNKLDFSQQQCPVTHCIWGFDRQELQHLLPKLKQGVALHKQTLINLIKYGKDSQLRENAIFILGHDSDYQALADLLIQFSDDQDESIRNNALRVLGAIIAKHKAVTIDTQRIIRALNYPLVTDRNKAAYVLTGYVQNHPESHQWVLDQAGDTLLALLKLHQPNNHDFAHHILKIISHQSFPDTDFDTWAHWVHDHQRQTRTGR